MKELENSIVILKDLLEIEYYQREKELVVRYRVYISPYTSMGIPTYLISNTAVKLYMLRRTIRRQRVCYSDLWLEPVTLQDKHIMKEKLGLINNESY